MRLKLSYEEIEQAILVHIFATTGMRLLSEDVYLDFIDQSDREFPLSVDELEIKVLKGKK
ncbi:hypothetical protein [Peribacillus frigoritolerans]|uniref:Uncharacterized protein n=1 Tax=Peribacillus castrilensis TaxID=2897690 RepID=A0AAW9NP20_9BACI|nr:hypothetical protein [Peribacillus castrilensis]